MLPGTHVWPHTGPTNCRLRLHLGLVIPKHVAIRVGRETKYGLETLTIPTNVSVTRGISKMFKNIIETGGGGGGVFNLAKKMVSVLHKELECKVEKLEYKTLEVAQLRFENKSEPPVGE